MDNKPVTTAAVLGICSPVRKQPGELVVHAFQRLQEVFRRINWAKVFKGHEEMLGMTPD